jgi:hypothetical protein
VTRPSAAKTEANNQVRIWVSIRPNHTIVAQLFWAQLSRGQSSRIIGRSLGTNGTDNPGTDLSTFGTLERISFIATAFPQHYKISPFLNRICIRSSGGNCGIIVRRRSSMFRSIFFTRRLARPVPRTFSSRIPSMRA